MKALDIFTYLSISSNFESRDMKRYARDNPGISRCVHIQGITLDYPWMRSSYPRGRVSRVPGQTNSHGGTDHYYAIRGLICIFSHISAYCEAFFDIFAIRLELRRVLDGTLKLKNH